MSTDYQHQNITGESIDLPVGKVVCIGGNYADHIKEMSSVVNDEAVFFIKPSTAIVPLTPSFDIPHNLGPCHNELEIAVLLKDKLKNADETQATDAIWGYGVALDLTLRQVQADLKKIGRPWERAKGFDGACPLSPFIAKDEFDDIQNVDFSLTVNQQVRQASNTKYMIRSIAKTLSQMSSCFTLLAGDVIITGTPAGVGPLDAGDKLELRLKPYSFYTQVSS